MSDCIYKTNVFLMGCLFVVSFISLLIVIINIYYDFQIGKNKIDTHKVYIKFFNVIIDIIIGLIVIFIGVNSLIYSSSHKLKFYMEILLIVIIIEIIIEYFYFDDIIKKIQNIEIISLNIVTVTQILFQILNMMFGYFEYTILLEEINNCPLNKVDDEITEDLYKNIILMSKEPNNIILQKNYNKLRNEQNSN